jgi:phospholipid transport system substrate-binding protein
MESKELKSRWLAMAFGVALLFAFLPFTLMAGAIPRPITVIQTGTDRALAMLRGNCSVGETMVLKHHRAEIEQIVRDYCDFGEMAMRSLGPTWKQQPPHKQQEFSGLFEQLIFNTYMNRVDTYTCADEKILYDEESVDGNVAVVKTRVTGYKGKDVAIEYRLRFKDDEWKAYDVVVEGVSLVNNYRQQFSSILNRESFDALLQRMRTKVAELK